MRYLFIIFITVGIVLQTGKISTARQDSIRKVVTVMGNSRIYSQFSTRKGNYQEIPRNFARYELNNTFNFSGIPVITSLFLSTEQSSSRQNISSFRISLDGRSIARNKLYEEFRFLSYFPTLEVGNCRPVYSPLILNGVNLRGVNVEFNPGHFYSAFATGRLVRAVREAAPEYQSYERNLTFGRLGVGKIRQSYFAMSFLHAKDDPESIEPAPYWYKSDPDTLIYNAETYIHGYDSSYLYILPKENYVASAELNLSLLKKKLLMTCEIAGSLATANQNAYGLTFDEIPEQFQEILFFNSSSRIDYAWVFRSILKLGNTEISGSARRIGPGFVSLGTAYLRTDVNQYEGNFVQFLSRKKVRVQFYYKSSRDNLLEWKSQTTRFINWGINANFRFSKAPWFTFLYSPYHSSYDMPDQTVNYDAGNLSLTSGYQFRLNKTSSLTNAMVSLQNGNNNLKAGNNEMKSMNLMFSETLNLGIPLSFFGSVGINDLESTQFERKTMSYNGRITFKGIKWMHSLLGISYTSWKDRIDRNKLYVNILINMGKFGTLTMQADRNSFVNHISSGKDYTEYIFRLGFAHRW
jgi:hypothetical protein